VPYLEHSIFKSRKPKLFMELLQPVQETLYTQIESPFGLAEYASTTQRFINHIIDTILFYVVIYGMGMMIGILFVATGRTFGSSGYNTFTGNKVLDYLVVYAVYILFYTFSEGASHRRFVGKLITRTKVVRGDESEISWKDAFIRSLCHLVPFEPFSAFGGYPWHDKWSHTKVIRINK
jgi:uncharacterized RDD family membrane protein YckC